MQKGGETKRAEEKEPTLNVTFQAGRIHPLYSSCTKFLPVY